VGEGLERQGDNPRDKLKDYIGGAPLPIAQMGLGYPSRQF